MNKQDERFLREAIQMAEASVKLNGGPFAAIIVRNGEIIGRGNNRVTLNLDPTAHAEIQAIRDACLHIGDYRLDGGTIYVSCEPCPMCLAACYWARLERIVFAASASDAAQAGFDDVHIRDELGKISESRQLHMVQGLRDEAQQAFKLWQGQADRLDY